MRLARSIIPSLRKGYSPVRGRAAFTIIEVLVVIGIIAFLIALLQPALSRARRQALVIKCASNLRSIGQAMNSYLNENKQLTFWRIEPIDLKGMEWYVYGGRETGNLCLQQGGIFNDTIPRPLNRYVSNIIDIFQCPEDVPGVSPWTNEYGECPALHHFEWVGNSYNFNANGDPELGFMDPTGQYESGLAGVRFTRIRDSSRTVLFTEAAHVWGYTSMGETAPWHPILRANVCFADFHVEFIERPRSQPNGDYNWGVEPLETGYADPPVPPVP